jgi:hypothetical protein
MKNRLIPAPLLLLVLLAGCGNETPVQVALDSHAAYDVTLSGLTAARQAGRISDEQKASIEKVRVPLYDSILAMDEAAIADNSTGFKSALKIFDAQIIVLKKWLLTAKAQTPTTPLK